MASTPLLGLSLPADGTTNWGTLVNTSITALIDSAVAGTTTLSSDADVTLTATTEATNQARQAVLLCSGARTAIRTITAPASSKTYIVINNTSGGYGVKVVGAGPTVGITVPSGKAYQIAWNGSDFVTTSTTTINLATDVSGTLPIANGGTGQTTQQAAINALVGTQTANRVLRSDGTNSTLSQVALTTDVTGTLPIGSGGTGQTTANAAFNALAPSQASANGKYLKSDGTNASWDAIDISTADITGTLPVGNGGTGATTLTGLLLGNGTSAVTTVTAPSGAVVGTTDTQTLTNKRITSRVASIASASTITPTGDTADQYNVTALAVPATVAAPSGTPTDGQKLIIRIKDNGTARALTWTTSSGAYRAIGVPLPTTTVANKTTYVGCIYNSTDVFWDVVAVTTQA